MPLWIHLANLIITKQAVEAKYPGGVAAFRAEHGIGDEDTYDQEDGELFGLSAMNSSELQSRAGTLIDLGFTYSETDTAANEFALLTRYGGVVARPAWLQFNSMYAWHTSCPAALQAKAQQVMGMDVDDFISLRERGEWPSGAIVE